MADREHPYVSSYPDRHGKTRWRFRRAGKTVQLSGGPDHPAFEAEYQAAIEGRPVKRASVHRLPTAAVPQSLGAAWRVLKSDTLEWKQLDPDTQYSHTNVIERFLQTPVVKDGPLTFRDIPVENLRRKDVKKILADRSDTPHAASHLLRVI